MSVFGGKIAFAYVIVGLIVAVVGGTLIEKLHMEDQVERVHQTGSECGD